ncbi:hypothetical protein D3C73_466810 [compost metagenome]
MVARDDRRIDGTHRVGTASVTLRLLRQPLAPQSQPFRSLGRIGELAQEPFVQPFCRIRQATENKREISLLILHCRKQLLYQLSIIIGFTRKPDLGPEHLDPFRLKPLAELSQNLVRRVDCPVLIRVDYRQQAFRQSGDVPLADARLVAIGVTPAMIDRGKHLHLMIFVEKGARAEVDRLPRYGHVVGVHHPMDETDAEPARDQLRLPECHGLQQCRIGVLGRLQLGIMPVDNIVGQFPYAIRVAARSKELEGADPHMACRDTNEDRTLLHRLAIDLLAGRHRRQRPCRRNAERSHGLGDDIFPQYRSQSRTAVATAGKWRRACAFQLDIATNTASIHHFAQQDRTAVAELRHETAELVAGISHRKRHRPLWHHVTGKCRRQPIRIGKIGLDAKLFRQSLVEHDQLRPLDRLGINRSVEPVGQTGIGVVEVEQACLHRAYGPFAQYGK